MTELVKRVWIQTPAGQWAPVVVGAGEDPEIRSVNVWDGTKWMTPTWGKLIKDEKGQSSTQLSSYQLRTTADVAYPPGDFNPNHDHFGIGDNFTPYSPIAGNFSRLFYLWPRTKTNRRSPDWRIVPLFYNLPKYPPSQAIYTTTDLAQFWPFATKSTTITLTGDPTSGVTEDEAYGGAVDASQFLYDAQNYPGPGSLGTYHDRYVVSHLDLGAIHTRLKEKYAERGVDLVGQYTHIDDMELRDIRVSMTVTLDATVEAPTSVDPQVLADAITFAVYSRGNNPGDGPVSYISQEWDTSADIHTAGGNSPLGADLVWEVSGINHDSTVLLPGGVNWQNNYRQIVTFSTTLDGPWPENGLTFYPKASAAWTGSLPTGVTYAGFNMVASVNRLVLLYAKHGVSVPANAIEDYQR